MKPIQVDCSLHGVLGQAKNGDELFWEEKFHAANGKAQRCTQGALLFPFKSFFWEGRAEDFFSYFPGSQCVLTMFPLSSQWVPIRFPLGSHQVPIRFPLGSPSSQCVPQHVLHNTSLLCHMLWQMLSSFSPVQVGQRGGTLYFKIEPSSLGTVHSKENHHYFIMSFSNIFNLLFSDLLQEKEKN